MPSSLATNRHLRLQAIRADLCDLEQIEQRAGACAVAIARVDRLLATTTPIPVFRLQLEEMLAQLTGLQAVLTPRDHQHLLGGIGQCKRAIEQTLDGQPGIVSRRHREMVER
jgi:hypothetical protein